MKLYIRSLYSFVDQVSRDLLHNYLAREPMTLVTWGNGVFLCIFRKLEKIR